MIHVAGLGVAGSYLFRRMRDSGFDVSGYDPKKRGFYIPCGYAVNINRLGGLMGNIGIEASEYLETEASSVTFESDSGISIRLPSSGFCTIDKNRLESDIMKGLEYNRRNADLPSGKGDLLIDATGVSRYYLGPAQGDLLMKTREYLTESSPRGDFYFRYFPSGKGYYWEFPLKNGYHIGAGGDSIDVVAEALDQVKNPIRVMSRNIRLSPLFGQIHRDNVIGVGESIGTVSPITGEGIVPSMESAEILFQCISKYSDIDELKEKYVAGIKRKFRRYEKLFGLLMNAREGNLRNLGNVYSISSAKEDFENFGIQLKILKVLRQIASS